MPESTRLMRRHGKRLRRRPWQELRERRGQSIFLLPRAPPQPLAGPAHEPGPLHHAASAPMMVTPPVTRSPTWTFTDVPRGM